MSYYRVFLVWCRLPLGRHLVLLEYRWDNFVTCSSGCGCDNTVTIYYKEKFSGVSYGGAKKGDKKAIKGDGEELKSNGKSLTHSSLVL